MNEDWKDIVGYDGIYQVSSCGNVQSKAKCGKYKSIKCIKSKGGYLLIRLYKNKVGKTFYAHRLVIETFLAPHFCPMCGTNMEIHHKDNNKLNNSISNLEFVTRKENVKLGHDYLKKIKGWSYQ